MGFFYFLVIQEKKVILKMCLKMVVIQKNFVLNLDQNLMVGKKSENQKIMNQKRMNSMQV